MYLIDTNVLIYAHKNIKKYANFLKKEFSKDNLAISTITVSEYIAGATKKEKLAFLEFIKHIETIEVDLLTSIAAGEYRKNLSSKSKKVYLLDCIIAATCKVHNLTLVTKNAKDYPMKDIRLKTL